MLYRLLQNVTDTAFVAGFAVVAAVRTGRSRGVHRFRCGASRARPLNIRGRQTTRAVVQARDVAGSQQLHQLENGQQQHVDKRDPSAGVDDFLGDERIWPYHFGLFTGTRHRGSQS